MPTGKAGITINSSLLNILITDEYRKVDFARQHNFRYQDIINWTLGLTRPSEHQVQKLCRALEITPEMLLIPGEIHISKGWQAALTRWAQRHIDNDKEPLRDADAINLIKSSAPDVMEETEDESKESPLLVQSSSDSSSTAE